MFISPFVNNSQSSPSPPPDRQKTQPQMDGREGAGWELETPLYSEKNSFQFINLTFHG